MERSKKHIIPKDRYRRKRRTFSGEEPERRDGADQGPSQQDNVTDEREPMSQAPQDDEIETQAASSDAEEVPATARRRENEKPLETEREYAPGEEGYRDRSAPASMGGTVGMTAGSDDADRLPATIDISMMAMAATTATGGAAALAASCCHSSQGCSAHSPCCSCSTS